MIKKILALGLFAMIGCGNQVYVNNERHATKILNEHADNCIARECSVGRNNSYCALLRCYDKFFTNYENVNPYKERARKIREAINHHIENYCGPDGAIKWNKKEKY
ncbi:hypothetical protein COU54_05205 [Candidatus Pacearchaeota archaeon CG10_big_fil_rev_8_21_14_0_10_31_24]|jgi:hypothetical protein|nr:MAG: hypothetical protein COU54_05205 [Candidatus Pacearchaeota archaeon CG10_big_fil_rev_8_21_14_0_10_31_24]